MPHDTLYTHLALPSPFFFFSSLTDAREAPTTFPSALSSKHTQKHTLFLF